MTLLLHVQVERNRWVAFPHLCPGFGCAVCAWVFKQSTLGEVSPP